MAAGKRAVKMMILQQLPPVHLLAGLRDAMGDDKRERSGKWPVVHIKSRSPCFTASQLRQILTIF